METQKGGKIERFTIVRKEIAATCPEHGVYMASVSSLYGLTVTSGCPDCEDNRIGTLSRPKLERHHERLSSFGVPARFLDLDWSDFTIDTERNDAGTQSKALRSCRVFAQKFKDICTHGTSLVLVGSPGTGKTLLASLIAKSVYLQGYSVTMGTVLRLIRSIRETYDAKGESEQDAIDTLVRPDLLIIDEVGVQYNSQNERNLFYEIVNGRYNESKPSILISNCTYEEVGQYVDDRILDRLSENNGMMLTMNWKSYRGIKVI